MIRIYSGPPGAGKSTLSSEWIESCERGICIPVDDIREWVLAGRADPVPEWTDETARQFALAEDAVADIAKRYADAGFEVAIDHCRLPENINAWVDRCFQGVPVEKIAVLPPLEIVLQRNLERTNKYFDPSVLEPAIRGIHGAYSSADLTGWTVEPNP